MLRARRYLIVLSVAVCAALSLSAAAAATPPDTSPGADRSAKASYLVRVDDVTSMPGVVSAAESAGGTIGFTYRHVYDGFSVELSAGAAQGLARNPHVLSIEPDGVATASATQAPTPSWGLDRIDQHPLPLDSSYTYASTGAGVTAYIVDTGIRATHTDLAGRVAAGATAVNDGRGTSDCNGHGTHVAGTVGGTKYGVAKAVTLVPVRVLGCSGSGSWSGVIAGLDWAVGNHTTGPAVLNMSLGGGANASVDAAVQRAVDDGIAVAVAAGNDNGANACSYSPARVASALTVGSSTSTDARSSFSNVGTCVDLFAPGSGISSDWSTSDTATNTISGTSMATPHTTGVAARYLGANPDATPAGVASALLAAATPGIVTNPGTGSPNLLLFAEPGGSSAPTAPGAPTGVSAVAGDAEATVSWSAPSSNGGSAITAYTVTSSPGGLTCSPVPLALSCTVTGLTNGVGHSFTVTATNAVGTSAPSAPSSTVTPNPPLPPAPIALTVTTTKVRSAKQANLSWSGASGAVDVYRSAVLLTTVSGSSYVDSTLAKGTATYSYRVCAAGDATTCSNTVTITF